jgi:hypothetical protein
MPLGWVSNQRWPACTAPAYGLLWLSVVIHLRNTAWYAQTEAMILAAETKSGLHALCRTDVLQRRVHGVQVEGQSREDQVQALEVALSTAQIQEDETRQQIDLRRLLAAQLKGKRLA